MTATALDLATNLTGGGITEAQEKAWFTAMRAAIAEMGDPMGRFAAIQNLSLTFAVAASALTCNVKTRASGTPSATDPVSVAVRDVTSAFGDFNSRNITAALSTVISSGSTAGHANATASYIYWYLIDNATVLELAWSSAFYGANGITTTTAEGGGGAADSATVIYSTVARASVPFQCIGRTTDTQVTAGTWAAAPTKIELWPFQDPPATQAQQEDGTELLAPVVPARQQYHPSAAKGWVQFDAAVNIGASYNVSGMTDNGVGSWTISWNQDFSSSNFVAVASVQQSPSGAASTLTAQFATAGLAAGATTLLVTDIGVTSRDATFMHCVAFGDQ